MVRIGRLGLLRHRAELQEDAAKGTYDTHGDVTANSTWQAVHGSSSVPCRITTLSGRELERARQLVAEATHEVTFHYRRGVSTQQRFRWIDGEGSTHLLSIEHLNNEEQHNRKYVATCVEEVNST